MAILSTIQTEGRRYHSCIGACPVKAIRIKKGQAEIIEEYCIYCGCCVRVSSENAIQIESHIELTWTLLANNTKVIAVLDPSFPAAFNDIPPEKLVGALKKLGFSEVYESAFGAQLISSLGYTKLLNNNRPIISSSCPVVVFYIEKYYPNLIPYLAPIVSPMIAIGRVIKLGIDKSAKVVFIGPCLAKKQEMKDEKVKGVIDAVLTYCELKEMFKIKNVDVYTQEEAQFDGPKPSLARAFSISGGLLKNIALESDILSLDIIVAEGKSRIIKVINDLSNERIKPKFVDLLFCEGCIDGPFMDNELSVFTRKNIIIDYTLTKNDLGKTEEDIKKFKNIDLKREFTPQDITLPLPSEKDIKEILAKIGKVKPEDELNCNACGYSTCRGKAIAVYQGLAEPEMCLPYLIDKLTQTQEDLIQAEKMTSLGQIAAGVAHEINNPLTGVLVYIKLLLKNINEKRVDLDKFKEKLETMGKEIDHSSRIIKNLLNFARQSKPQPRMCNLHKKIDDALNLSSNQAKLNNVKIIKEFDSIPQVFADPDQMQQVFVNIILNAIQAMPNGGTLIIKTRYKDKVEIAFTDTGFGIRKEDMSKLFTPFFTTKGKGKGVGLGLAVCYGIVQHHNGEINVESEEGKGTTFTIRLNTHHN